jgi:hypothetical protein
VAHEHLQRISELAGALDVDIDIPIDPNERLRYLERHRQWLHGIQELTLSEIEQNWQQQQVARGEIYGA